MNYLQDRDGNNSSKRLGAMLCLIQALALAWYGAISGHDVNILVGSFLGGALGNQIASAVGERP